MKASHTTFWLFLAAALFACIYLSRRHPARPPAGPVRLFPNLKPGAVTLVQVSDIVAVRTNASWQLVRPVDYPANSAAIEALLSALERLTSAVSIAESEIRSHTNADAEYGFSSPRASILLDQAGDRPHLLFGSLTPPGDQVFAQLVGVEGAFVVDAGLLKLLPRSPDDWRERTVIGRDALECDRLAVTNKTASFVLQREPANRVWRMVSPLDNARADNPRIEYALRQLATLQVSQFLPQDSKPDLDGLGLAPPEFELGLGQGTNTTILLQFGRSLTNAALLQTLGKSITNDPGQVFARRAGQNTLFTVATNPLALWRVSSHDLFRDPRLLTFAGTVQRVVAAGTDNFSLARDTNGLWRVWPEGFLADPVVVEGFLSEMTNFQIIEFVRQVVNPPDLPGYGLAPPALEYRFESQLPPGLTNTVLADVQFGFGTNQHDRVFARRLDESAVYAISTNDFSQMPAAGWQLRDRKLFASSEDDVASVTILKAGKTRQLVRRGPHKWSLGPTSTGMINDLAVEESVRGILRASALAWVGRGETNRPAFGLAQGAHRLEFTFKNGTRSIIEFGVQAPSGNQYAALLLDDQPWFCEFPWMLYGDVVSYLSPN